jgi:hypothetical protein
MAAMSEVNLGTECHREHRDDPTVQNFAFSQASRFHRESLPRSAPTGSSSSSESKKRWARRPSAFGSTSRSAPSAVKGTSVFCRAGCRRAAATGRARTARPPDRRSASGSRSGRSRRAGCRRSSGVGPRRRRSCHRGACGRQGVGEAGIFGGHLGDHLVDLGLDLLQLAPRRAQQRLQGFR